MDKGTGAGCIEIESIEELEAHVLREKTLRGLAVQGLDLSNPRLESAVSSLSAEGAYFLGCAMSRKAEAHIRQTGGTIFPNFRDQPFDAYRASLYTVAELMDGYERGHRASLENTLDGRIYAYFRQHRINNRPIPIIPALSFRIHDHAIDNALYDLLYPANGPALRVVAVMGGHKMRRDDGAYPKVARIAARLTELGYFVASGGGPGAMEAANLGAYFAGVGDDALAAAVASMADQASHEDPLYIERAYEVIDRYPKGQQSLAVPTWFYGHEPTNLFASHVAKYFANSLREDGILAIARHGVIYAPGSAGTVQEVFMDAAQNRYTSYGVISPMVFLGKEYWTQKKPVYPLLKTLARDRAYEKLLSLSDEPEEIVGFLRDNPPISTDLRG